MTLLTEHDALIADIIANPDDDILRLIFADWCEDAGDRDRADFIRMQIAMHEAVALWNLPMDSEDIHIDIGSRELTCKKPTPELHVEDFVAMRLLSQTFCYQIDGVFLGGVGEPDVIGFEPDPVTPGKTFPPEYRERARRLLRRRACDWFPASAAVVDRHIAHDCQWQRGFCSRIIVRQDEWLKHGRALARCHPIEVVTLIDKNPMDNCAWHRDDAEVNGKPLTFPGGRHLPRPILPRPIWDRLEGYSRLSTGCLVEDGPNIKAYKGNEKRLPGEEAREALSRACLAWARQEEKADGP